MTSSDLDFLANNLAIGLRAMIAQQNIVHPLIMDRKPGARFSEEEATQLNTLQPEMNEEISCFFVAYRMFERLNDAQQSDVYGAAMKQLCSTAISREERDSYQKTGGELLLSKDTSHVLDWMLCGNIANAATSTREIASLRYEASLDLIPQLGELAALEGEDLQWAPTKTKGEYTCTCIGNQPLTNHLLQTILRIIQVPAQHSGKTHHITVPPDSGYDEFFAALAQETTRNSADKERNEWMERARKEVQQELEKKVSDTALRMEIESTLVGAMMRASLTIQGLQQHLSYTEPGQVVSAEDKTYFNAAARQLRTAINQLLLGFDAYMMLPNEDKLQVMHAVSEIAPKQPKQPNQPEPQNLVAPFLSGKNFDLPLQWLRATSFCEVASKGMTHDAAQQNAPAQMVREAARMMIAHHGAIIITPSARHRTFTLTLMAEGNLQFPYLQRLRLSNNEEYTGKEPSVDAIALMRAALVANGVKLVPLRGQLGQSKLMINTSQHPELEAVLTDMAQSTFYELTTQALMHRSN